METSSSQRCRTPGRWENHVCMVLTLNHEVLAVLQESVYHTCVCKVLEAQVSSGTCALCLALAAMSEAIPAQASWIRRLFRHQQVCESRSTWDRRQKASDMPL